jgi:hypothetical protein
MFLQVQESPTSTRRASSTSQSARSKLSSSDVRQSPSKDETKISRSDVTKSSASTNVDTEIVLRNLKENMSLKAFVYIFFFCKFRHAR